MLTLSLIGIGCGDPRQLTLAAIDAINAADLVLIPRKGADKSDLAELRRTICAQVVQGNTPRLVEFDLPQRDAGREDYRGSVTPGTTRLPLHGRSRSPRISAARGGSRC